MTIQELELCIDEYGREIYSFCRQLTGSTQEGEELYQDTFLKATELAGRIDGRRNPRSYLLSIAIRIWKNKKRKIAWRKRIAGMYSLEEESSAEGGAVKAQQEDQGPLPEEILLCKEQQELLQSYIAELPDKYRMALYLYYTAELSIEEISHCIKVPAGTVKSRLHQARTILRSKLEVAGYDR